MANGPAAEASHVTTSRAFWGADCHIEKSGWSTGSWGPAYKRSYFLEVSKTGACSYVYSTLRGIMETMIGGIMSHWKIGVIPVPRIGRVGIAVAYCHLLRTWLAIASTTTVMTIPLAMNPVTWIVFGWIIQLRDLAVRVISQNPTSNMTTSPRG